MKYRNIAINSAGKYLRYLLNNWSIYRKFWVKAQNQPHQVQN
jgi:hypothetical protein